MFWIIITVLCVSAIIIGAILMKVNSCSDAGIITTLIGSLCTFVFGLILFCQIADEINFLTKYEMLSNYTENYNYSNEAEKAVIAGKKYDFNEELIDRKTLVENYSFFWIMPEKIKALNYLS